ncbi:MAG: DUF58 domain-containing protein [Planctomycetes bacterium]|nr:DUF58 domain-containing protein [Planctomycetota bacterium]
MKFGSDFIRTLDALNLMARRLLSSDERADRRTPRRGASLEFADYRRYAPGDEIRYIDWNVYARHGSLFVKEFSAEENVHVSLVMDLSASMTFGRPPKFEAAGELAAALGYIGLAHFDSVSLYSLTTALAPIAKNLRGKASAFALLAAIETLQPSGSTDFGALAAPWPGNRGKSLILLLSDFYDPTGYGEGLRRLLAQRHEVHLIHLVAREEIEPAERGRYFLIDLETGRKRDVPITEATLDQYRARFRAFCAELERFATEHELYYVRVRSDEPLEKRVRDIFRRSGILDQR